jgi:hypothetical protein
VFQTISAHVSIQQVKLKVSAEKHIRFSSHVSVVFLSHLPETEMCRQITKYFISVREPGSLASYSEWLQAGRSGDRIPVGGEIFRTSPHRT